LDELARLRERYSKAEEEWREKLYLELNAIVSGDGFNELEFIYHAGISPQEWINLLKHKERIADDSWLYAKLHYFLGIRAADPRHIPARLHIRFGKEITELVRAISSDEYIVWASAQKPPFVIGTESSGPDPVIKAVADLITMLLTSDKVTRDRFAKANGLLLSYIVPFLTAMSLDPGSREREVLRLVMLNRSMLERSKE